MQFPLDEKYIIETEKELDILFLDSVKAKGRYALVSGVLQLTSWIMREKYKHF